MLKRFQIWLYKKWLEKRFKKNNKWEINEDFVLAVTDKFNDKWLRDRGPLHLTGKEISIHYKKIGSLLTVLDNMNRFIDKEETVVVDGNSYSTYPETKQLIDYLTDEKKKLIDVYEFQIELKVKTNRLVYLLRKSKEGSEIQYGYYRRHCDKLFSDILDIYSSFLEVAET